MTRLQTFLVVALGSLLVGRVVWDALGPLAASGADASVLALRSVPEAAWHTGFWIAFSAVWWLPCALGKRACGRSSCSAPSAA